MTTIKHFFTLIETQKKCGIHTASVEVEAFLRNVILIKRINAKNYTD